MKNKYSPTKKTKLPSVNERKESLDASSTQELGDAVSAAEHDTNRKKYTYHNSRVITHVSLFIVTFFKSVEANSNSFFLSNAIRPRTTSATRMDKINL